MSEQKRNIQAKVIHKTIKELKKMAIDEELTLPDFVGKLLDSIVDKKLKKINNTLDNNI